MEQIGELGARQAEESNARLGVLARGRDDNPLGTSRVNVDASLLDRRHLAGRLNDIVGSGRRPVKGCRVARREEVNAPVAEDEGLAVIRDAKLRVESAVGRVEADRVQQMLN